MLFYEIEFKSPNTIEKKDKDSLAIETKRISRKTVFLNGKIAKNINFYVYDISKDNLNLVCAILDKNKDDYKSKAKEFVKRLEYDVSFVKSEEITIETFMELVQQAEMNDYLDDNRKIYKALDMLSVYTHEGSTRLKEEIVEPISSKEIAIQKCQKLLCVPEIEPEIERIFTESKQKSFYAHPVHYILMVDDLELKEEIRKILVGSLYSAGRLSSKRICYVGTNTSREEDCIDTDVAEDLYYAEKGSTIIFQPIASMQIGGTINKNYEILQQICQLIKKYHSNTLNIIELKRSDERTLEQIKSELPELKFVVLKENMIFTETAKKYLKGKAKAAGINDCKKLISELPSTNQGFYKTDLEKIYTKWFDDRLCTDVYPQYKCLEIAEKSVKKKKADGDAFQQLQSLIGLKEAKKVIQDAINYQKVRKIFDQNGLTAQNTARHMIFTGNPGSAKTTVARLFAQIMKDNQVLPEGNLIECGRADIVDMYVGGTAPRVQRLFKKAVGNVLFIDEAYSLVDDRRGLYGDEAINTIVQEMENHRDDTIVIFAGYPDKMEQFLDTNPGLRSRIAFHVNFEDYNPDELTQILQLFAKQDEMNLSPEILSKTKRIFEEACTHPDFGNGRFVRNIYEQARMRQASRLISMNSSELTCSVLKTLDVSDFEMPSEYTSKNVCKTIGFAS